MAVGDEAGEEQRLAARIESLEAGLAERDAKLAERDVRLAERDVKLAELVELVAKLTSQIEKLTEQLGQNSKNSHRPPSSDGPGAGSRGGASGQHRPGSGRKRGGQKGHRGSYRALLPAAQVDQFIDLFPDVCLGCARALQRGFDAAACRHQQLDLRDHRPHLTEIRRHELLCGHCGTWTRAAYGRESAPARHAALARDARSALSALRGW